MIDQVNHVHITLRRVRRLMCVFTGLLVLSTWPLWIPGREFPEIPWLEWFCPAAEAWWDWIPLAALALWLVLEYRGLPRDRHRTWIIRVVLGGAVLFALIVDQHRMQPWAWQMLLMAAILSVASERTAVRCLRWFIVSIYVHSALSKVDMAFLESHGQWLLQGLSSSVGLSTEMWSESTRLVLAAMFPAGELLTALLLLWPRTRRIGLVLAVTMHTLLILALGPLGEGQKPAVLMWNLFFILLDLLLFGRAGRIEERDSKVPSLVVAENEGSLGVSTRTSDAAAIVLTGVFALLPCLSWRGYWDHWPSWAVYSSRPAIVQVFVPQEQIGDMPESLRPFVGPPEPLGDLCPVNLDAWSFDTLWCPMYPQERFRVAIAATLGVRHHLERMRVVIHSPPDRWTGKREKTVLDGKGTVLSHARQSDAYLLNTTARVRAPIIPDESEN